MVCNVGIVYIERNSAAFTEDLSLSLAMNNVKQENLSKGKSLATMLLDPGHDFVVSANEESPTESTLATPFPTKGSFMSLLKQWRARKQISLLAIMVIE